MQIRVLRILLVSLLVGAVARPATAQATGYVTRPIARSLPSATPAFRSLPRVSVSSHAVSALSASVQAMPTRSVASTMTTAVTRHTPSGATAFGRGIASSGGSVVTSGRLRPAVNKVSVRTPPAATPAKSALPSGAAKPPRANPAKPDNTAARSGTAPAIGQRPATTGLRRSKKPIADLKRASINDPKQPRHVRGWLENQRRQRGSSPYRWRNPPGLQAGHPHGKPFRTHGDAGGALKWETAKDNRLNGILVSGKQTRR